MNNGVQRSLQPRPVLGGGARRLGPYAHDRARERGFVPLGPDRRYPSRRPPPPKT